MISLKKNRRFDGKRATKATPEDTHTEALASVIKYKLCMQRYPSETHMSNALDQIPVDKTWSPTESSRKMKPEAQ